MGWTWQSGSRSEADVAGKPGRSGRPRTFPVDGPDAAGRPVYIRLPRRMRDAAELLAGEWRVSLSTTLRTLFARAIEGEIQLRKEEERLRQEAERVERERRSKEAEAKRQADLFARANTVTLQLKQKETGK